MRPTRLHHAAALVAASLLLLAACSDGDSQADSATGTTAAAATTESETEVESTTATAAEPGETEPAETEPAETETAETEPNETGEPDETDDVAQLCDGYLTFLGQGGVDDLAEALGPDAPPGVLEAIELTRSTDVDFLDLLNGLESLKGYVAPVCRERWDADLAPAASDQDAVNTFFAALVAGDKASANPIAPDDVLANFEPWEPIEPDPELGPASLNYGGGGDFSMLLEPTVSVFCEVSGGVVTSCLFGE